VAGSPFLDAWQSLDWADGEAETVNTEIKNFREGQPYPIKAESYPDNTGGEIALNPVRGRRNLVLWSKRVGAAIGYMRAALNYATYQIALIDCPGKADWVEFPVFDNPGRFQQENRVKGFAQHRYALIETMQPYHGRTDALWWLHELARLHRHRLIRPVVDIPVQSINSLSLIRGSLDDITLTPNVLTEMPEDKTVIARWHNSSPAETQVDVEPDLAVKIVLDDPLVRHESVPVLLFKMCQLTRDLLTALEHSLP
jgi:hypothetical protein